MKSTDTRQMFRAQGRNGSGFLVVMFVTFMLMAFGMLMVTMANSASYRVRKDTQAVQAQALAESGAAEMLAALRTNYSYWVGRSLSNSIVTGSTTGTYIVSTTSLGGNCRVDSTGKMLKESRIASLEVLGTAKARKDALFPTNMQILAEEYISLETSAMDIYGNIHGNADVLNKTGNPGVHGSISAVGIIQVTPDGAKIEHAPRRELPTFNFESYRQKALAGGLYYPNSVTLKGVDMRPANGVVYCNGNITIGNNSTLVGCLVAKGNITINNLFVQTQFSPGMPSMLATGSIEVNNNNDFYGVIYAGLSFTSLNNKLIRGGIISGGWVRSKNHMQVYETAPDWDPLDVSTGAQAVVVGGWLR